ncbi:hypothetical protein Heshes_13800 [Alicyclobacillus hesperidum]|uniref:Uncharacterized protein n=1 Tax=Alicyclobacillus hesperidum TaxID=89784 RepID=A0A1H2T0B9_9BACL|nr:hypothetical protein [Alicyclobacillus hesperidum]GLV13696.1 hypothetical protein Heshes_13800 [Alicyclobacillus hesperidum]SDW37288.1 hypothetical protein SAMN04489725_10511 [Alicyclobacillus hesperidum]
MTERIAHHALVFDNSRKAKSVRQLYDVLRARAQQEDLLDVAVFGEVIGRDGVRVREPDRYKVLNLRLQDEHMSPYFRTSMNLFQMLMLDESIEMSIFRAERAWLFEFHGVATGPVPFGQNGFDLR